MGKHKNAARGEANAQKVTSPTLSSHGGEAGHGEETGHDLRDNVASLEEQLSQMGAPSRMPFRFMQSSQLPSKWSLSPEHQQDHPAHEDQTCYCIHVRLTLGERWGNHPPPSHAWSGSLIGDTFLGGLEEQITKAVVLAPGEAILFFGCQSLKEGIPLRNARNVGFSLTGPVNWVCRTVQVQVTVNTIQEGHQAIVDAVVEMRTKVRGPGHP